MVARMSALRGTRASKRLDHGFDTVSSIAHLMPERTRNSRRQDLVPDHYRPADRLRGYPNDITQPIDPARS
jgi:hypothetical protein